jgi:hypothetical protein
MTRSNAAANSLLPWMGLAIGPTVWAINTQASQILVYTDCAVRMPILAVLSGVAALISLGSGWLSWRDAKPVAVSAPAAFIGSLGLLTALIFAYALVLQGISALVLTGCER